MDSKRFPYVPPELIAALDEAFPSLAPQKHESWEDLRWRGGQRSVVEFLKRHHDDQHRNALEGDP